MLSGEQVRDVGPYVSRKANKPLVLQWELAGNSQGQQSCVKSAASPFLGCSWPQCVAVVFFFIAHLMGPTSSKLCAVACSPARPPRQALKSLFKSSVPSCVLIFAFCSYLEATSLSNVFSWTKFTQHSVAAMALQENWWALDGRKKVEHMVFFFTPNTRFLINSF